MNQLRTLIPLLIAAASLTFAADAAKPDFNRDIRPILSQNCFKCHGMDDKTRKGALRLDVREAALAEAKSGAKAIVPGKPDQSELIARINSKDSEEVMPPPATKKTLTEKEKELLKAWIVNGADYAPHWAFIAPKAATPPNVNPQTGKANNPIDNFVLARLEKEGLKQSPEADKYALCRRVYLDLIGLPPTPEEADAFAKDSSPEAYDKLVDKLLASPHYGERWARRWLDLARYADTNGYEKDRGRTIWPYRDWVVKALNADMPFDQFTLKQVAGDLLPSATPDDIVATGLHRNTMLNEEGGIDPNEFRYYAMVDRVNTTGVAWLGLTLGCCQCHTHKYDPILQKEYYQIMAFLNNADEPEYEIPDEAREKKRQEIEEKIAKLRTELPNKWQVPNDVVWNKLTVQGSATSGSKVEVEADGALKFSGDVPDKDSYTLSFDTENVSVDRLKLEVLSNGKTGPGRAHNGNFVLSEITITATPKDTPEKSQTVKIGKATADFSQKDFDISASIDGKPETGWAIDDGTKKPLPNRTATFFFEKPQQFEKGAHWTVKLDQNYGGKHTIGKLRLSAGAPVTDKRPTEERRKEAIEKRFAEWEKSESEKAIKWQVLKPTQMISTMPHLVQQDDGSILASGDVTKSEVYDLKFDTKISGVTALRLEALPHPSLPGHGPGMCFYEGPKGQFFLSELHILLGDKRLKIPHASNSGGSGTAAQTQDENMISGWSGEPGKPTTAVFNFEKPIDLDGSLALKILCEKYHAAPLGHFRISVTTDSKPAEARGNPADIEALLAKPSSQRTEDEKKTIQQHFFQTAPECASAMQEIQNLRNSIPKLQTTLVMRERPAENPRKTFIYHRGEFLQPKEEVSAAVPAFLPQVPANAPNNRLTFAQWLVSPENPLTARVTVNRHWQAFFGRGIVRTLEDFGYQGEMPSHPELLDWLALEFMKQGWSFKKLHKLIVTSATYRQASQVSPELAQRDPNNVLLARGPRVRLEAEIVRDSMLKSAALLSEKMGGPGVYPPQPSSVTTEGTYGALAWNASNGEDRYRRTLYTYMKRTAPFAMCTTFDGPSGEACLAKREVSNSPLQALTLLNDAMFMEAAQALGKQLAAQQASDEVRARILFRRCLVRNPEADELTLIVNFAKKQRERITAKQINAEYLAGKGDGDVNERAVWTAAARAVLNLDEAISKR